jgi:4-hydroxy-3-polyprenylbenzoate decarboxylase
VPIEELSEFVSLLDKAGELKRVKTQVDTNLEISEILGRVMYSNGPAVLFENIKNYDMPVLGNAFGSMKRMEIGLETSDFTEIGQRIVDMTKIDIPTGIIDKIRKLPELSKITDIAPKLQKSGRVNEVFEDSPSFEKIPILKT